jgi:hypothetical protein
MTAEAAENTAATPKTGHPAPAPTTDTEATANQVVRDLIPALRPP